MIAHCYFTVIFRGPIYIYNIDNKCPQNLKYLLQQSKDKRNFPDHFMMNGKEITDSNIIAIKFCKYVIAIGSRQDIKMPPIH